MAGHRYASPSPQPPRHQGLCAIEKWRVHDSEFAFKSFATVPLSFHGCRPTKSKFDVCVCVCVRVCALFVLRTRGEGKEEIEKERERRRKGWLDRKRKKRGRNGEEEKGGSKVGQDR